MSIKAILDDFNEAIAIGDAQWLKELLSENIPNPIQDITILDLQFCEAAQSKHDVKGPQMMDAFLDAGMSINHISSLGEAPIHKVTTVHMLRHLHARGADLNLYDEFGAGLIHNFCTNMVRSFTDLEKDGKDKAAVIEGLAQLGAELNLRNKYGQTALHRIIERGLAQTHSDKSLNGLTLAMNTLIANGLDVNARNMQGATALGQVCFACASSNSENWLQPLIKPLLDAGARFDLESGQFESAIMAAIEVGDLKAFRHLTKTGMPTKPQKPWPDFLVRATKIGKPQFVRELLEGGYHVDHEKISEIEKKNAKNMDSDIQQCLGVIRSHVCAVNASMALKEIAIEEFGGEARESVKTQKDQSPGKSIGKSFGRAKV